MRILLLCFGIIVSISLIAQNDKLPSKKKIETQDNKIPSKTEMQAQMKQTVADARKQREDVRKQIADAKANNSDPESIKQLENQLSSLDLMIEMLDKTSIPDGSHPKTLARSKTIEPTLASPFTPIQNLKRPFQIPKKTEAKDKLLWYKGKKLT